MKTVVRLRRARDARGEPLAGGGPCDEAGRGCQAAADFLRMGVLLLGSAAGFGIAAAGTWLTGNGPVSAAAGGFALLCGVLAFRNFRRWWRGEES